MSAGRYTLIRRLGDGNFTAGVHLASHKDMDKKVAIKLLKIEPGAGREELLGEAKRMAALDRHDHVVTVLDAGDWDTDHVYIASEVCPGGSLAKLAQAPLDPATACRYVSGSCRGLSYMHEHGLLHLDVRPANILLDNDVPKIIDFGLSRWTTDTTVPHVYTPHAAPELARSGIGTSSSDQFAMAMTLAHLLTAGAICANPPADVHQACLRREWPRLNLIEDNTPTKLQRVIAKATKVHPGDRYPDIEAFKRAVDQSTPKVSFSVIDPATMASADGTWTIAMSSKGTLHNVEVLKNNRHVRADGTFGVTAAEAARHRKKLITAFAGY